METCGLNEVVILRGKAPPIRLRDRIRIKTSYWGYRLKGEVFVNVNVKVNDGWWKVKSGRGRRRAENLPSLRL